MNTANLLLKEITGQHIPMNDFLPTQKKSGKGSPRVKEEISSPRNAIVEGTEKVPTSTKDGTNEISANENVRFFDFLLKENLRKKN